MFLSVLLRFDLFKVVVGDALNLGCTFVRVVLTELQPEGGCASVLLQEILTNA